MPTNLPARRLSEYSDVDAPATPQTLLLQVALLILVLAGLLVGSQAGILVAPSEFPAFMIGP
jgi:ABC-type xylose transport system permease subunit